MAPSRRRGDSKARRRQVAGQVIRGLDRGGRWNLTDDELDVWRRGGVAEAMGRQLELETALTSELAQAAHRARVLDLIAELQREIDLLQVTPSAVDMDAMALAQRRRSMAPSRTTLERPTNGTVVQDLRSALDAAATAIAPPESPEQLAERAVSSKLGTSDEVSIALGMSCSWLRTRRSELKTR